MDESAAVVAYNEFDPYGNPIEHGSEPYGYTGEWWVSYMELLHLRARWYSAGTGTFLSKDVWEGDELRPLTLNGWGYVEGNPINRIDPSGQQGVSCLEGNINVVVAMAEVCGGGPKGAANPAITKRPPPRVGTPPAGKDIRQIIAEVIAVCYAVKEALIDNWPTGITLPGTQTQTETQTEPQPTVECCPYDPQPTPTPDRDPKLLMHYTSKQGYTSIIHPGVPGPYIMKPSPAELSAPAGIYFTDALPYPGPSGPYDRHWIAAALGIAYSKTEFYIMIERDRLPGRWRTRHKWTVRPEWIYVTNVSVDVTQAVIDHGPVSNLNP